MPAPIILVPPSEGKASGGRGPATKAGSMSFAVLDERRAQVVDALSAAMGASETARAKLLGVKGDALAEATEANLGVRHAATMPAIRRYTGVLYDALDHGSLSGTAKRRAARQLVIVSGLWGLVTPADPIPTYKLKMGASLDGVGRLATWWRPAITEALAPAVEKRTVWDLLPSEHSAAWAPDRTALRRRITVRFLDDVPDGRGRKLVTVSHWNKLLKGALVRHILETQLDTPDGLADFDHPQGYVYRPDLTVTTGHLTEVTMVTRRG